MDITITLKSKPSLVHKFKDIPSIQQKKSRNGKRCPSGNVLWWTWGPDASAVGMWIVNHLQGWVMDKIFEVDSTAVLSKVSEAAVTHCRQDREREMEKGCETQEKKREKKSTLLHGNNIMPFCRPHMSNSLNVTLVLRFERIWVMSKHITQQKHATTSVENHTLRPSCILCNGGHTVTHQRALTLLSTCFGFLQPVWWWAEQAPLIAISSAHILKHQHKATRSYNYK